MDIGQLIRRHAAYRPDRMAVVYGETRLTYREFNADVNRMANALRRAGIGKGDKVATVLPNCLELLSLFWAVAKTGAVAVPLSPLLGPTALAALLRDSDSTIVFTTSTQADTFDEIRDQLPAIGEQNVVLVDGAVAGERPGFRGLQAFLADASFDEPPNPGLTDADLFNIFYSSGTTGEPKGIMHSHYVRAMYGSIFASSWRMTPESVCMHTGAIIFNGAWVTLMPTFFSGATYVLHAAFDATEVIRAIAREKVTHIMLVPTQIISLLNHPEFTEENVSSLEMVLSLGAPLHLEHKQRLNALLPHRFYELYGLTEGFVTVLDKYDYEAKPSSVGVPPPFFDMRIVDEDGHDAPPGIVGEIVGRGPILMPGYYKRPDLTAETIVDGWLFSGDLGYVDEDGFLFLVDRKKDLIISGGVNVYPRDIEEVLVQHPDVEEVAVFGIPDPKWGETPVAAIRLHQDCTADPEDLKAWINQRVEARFQRVSRVAILDDFPRNAAGKTLKRVMRDEFASSD